jgi:hypothetical protein
MNDEELKRLWRQQALDRAKLSPDDQMRLMRIKLKCLDRGFLWADAIIITLGALCMVVFARTFLKTPLPVARIGLAIIIASLAYDIWKPIRARRLSPRPPADAPVAQWLRHELEKVRAESELKRAMLWSYVLPFWIGAIIFTWGLDTHLSSRIFFSAVLTGLNAIIYVGTLKLNQYTSRKACQPLKAELESLLKSNAPE